MISLFFADPMNESITLTYVCKHITYNTYYIKCITCLHNYVRTYKGCIKVVIDIYIYIIYAYVYIYIYLKQKHPRCKKSEANSEAPGSFNSCTRLKSVISGGGQGPSCLLATM